MTLPFRPVLRNVRSTDQGFVASGFAKQLVSRGIGRTEANTLVDYVLDSRFVSIMVAADPDNTDRIVGWIVYVPQTVAWRRRVVVYVYTRDKYRGMGVAAALFARAFPNGGGKIMHTFVGPDAGTLLQRYPSQYVPINELLEQGAA